MSSSINVSAVNSDADCNTIQAAPAESLKAALPRPIRSVPSIADTGRISFGAGYRLPTKK